MHCGFFYRIILHRIRLSLCLCQVREAGIWACCCGRWCYLVCSCTKPPELQLLHCLQPAGGLTATPLSEVPFQLCWGRWICHKMAKVIVFMVCITQGRVGCGFKGTWLSSTVYLAAAYQVICKVIHCLNAGIKTLQIFYIYKKEECFILRKIWFTVSGKQEQSTSKKGQLYFWNVFCVTLILIPHLSSLWIELLYTKYFFPSKSHIHWAFGVLALAKHSHAYLHRLPDTISC